MADELATITGTVLRNTAGDADAAPWPHAAVVATPVLLDESAALVDGQTRVRARADAAGLVTLHLWPGAWRITLPDGEVIDGADHAGVVVEAGVSYDLLTLRGFVPGPGVSVTTLVVPAGATAGQNLGWDGTDLSWVDGVAPETVAAAVEDYLTAHPVDADPAGTAAAAVSAHELAADPHPGYTTAAEAAAAAPVQSVAGRTGAVTLAVADVAGAVATTDPRLSDARTPTAHTHDDRYYTETESDARYATAAQGALAASASQPGHTHTLDATTDTATRVAMTPAERTKLGQQSGVNTGDQTLPTWTTIAGKPAVVAAGATQADARTAIGAGTSNLTIGTTAGTAKAGDYAPDLSGYAPTTAPGLLGRYVGVNAQTGTSYTPVLTDEGKLVTFTNAAAVTLTLPQDSDLAFPVGGRFDFVRSGGGSVTAVAGTGATASGTPSLVLRAQWSAASAIKIAVNTWLVVGDLA